MKVLISGATGFIGREILNLLLEEGHEVFALTRYIRDAEHPKLKYIFWENVHTPFDLGGEQIDAVINLVGENIASDRWNNEKKKSIYNSRIDGTRMIIQCLKDQKIKAFISTSAIGIFGDRKGEGLDENSHPSDDFMARVCVDWEKEALLASTIAERVAIIRVGLVLGAKGGLIAKTLPLFKLGFGGKLGDGDQYMSWIHIKDLAKLYVTALTDSSYKGIYHGVSPYPVRNKEFTKTFGRILEKPAFFKVPKLMLKIATGEMTGTILSDAKVLTPKLKEKKFYFRYPTLELALKDVLSKERL